MTFDWHRLYPLHTVIFDNSQVFGGVPCKAQLCNFSEWFFSPRFGVVPIWELWQFCYVRIEPPKNVLGFTATPETMSPWPLVICRMVYKVLGFTATPKTMSPGPALICRNAYKV